MKKIFIATTLVSSVLLSACTPWREPMDLNGIPDKSPNVSCTRTTKAEPRPQPQRQVQPTRRAEPESEGLRRLRAQNTQPLAVGTSIMLDSYSFDTGSAYLGRDARLYLSEKAAELKGVRYNRIVVTGHADSSGNAADNQVLSERRARAVADFLIAEGVPANKIVSQGRGSREPIASNATAEGRKMNRRVHISVE